MSLSQNTVKTPDNRRLQDQAKVFDIRRCSLYRGIGRFTVENVACISRVTELILNANIFYTEMGSISIVLF